MFFVNNNNSQANPNEITYAQLEILKHWCPNLSSRIKEHIFDTFTNLLINGSVSDRHVERVFDICVNIILNSSIRDVRKSNQIGQSPSSQSRETEIIAWCQKIHETSEQYILMHLKKMVHPERLDSCLVNYLFIYSQTTSELPDPANAKIIESLVVFLKMVTSGKLKCKFNCVFVLCTKKLY